MIYRIFYLDSVFRIVLIAGFRSFTGMLGLIRYLFGVTWLGIVLSGIQMSGRVCPISDVGDKNAKSLVWG